MNRQTCWTAAITGCAGLVVLLGLASAAPATGGQNASGRVAVVDVVKIFNESQQHKDLGAELKEMETRLDAENQMRRQKIDALQATLDALDPSDPVALTRADELVAMQIEYKNWTEMVRAAVQREMALWEGKIYREICRVTEEIARAQGYDAVLLREDFQQIADPQAVREQIRSRKVIFASANVDVTQTVLDKLNAEYRTRPRAKMLRPVGTGARQP